MRVEGVVYYMCTGEEPSMLWWMDDEEISTGMPGYDPILKRLVLQCGHEDPDKRPNACEIYHTALRVLDNI